MPMRILGLQGTVLILLTFPRHPTRVPPACSHEGQGDRKGLLDGMMTGLVPHISRALALLDEWACEGVTEMPRYIDLWMLANTRGLSQGSSKIGKEKGFRCKVEPVKEIGTTKDLAR